jgi:long-chain acyl-CoA synthetase
VTGKTFRISFGSSAPDGWSASEDLLRDTAAAPPPEARPPVVGSLTYSTGTSGLPKGIYRSGGLDPDAVERGIRALGFSSDDVHLMSGPCHHSAAWGFATLNQLLGATCVVLRSFHPRRAVELLDEHEVTTAVMAPVHLRQLLELPREVLARHSFPRLRVLMVTGAPFPEADKLAALEVFGDALHESYGSTETGMVTLANGDAIARRPASVGRPMDGVELRVLDDGGEPVPPGTPGLLWVRTPSLFERYWGDVDGSRRSSDGFFTAGDVGLVDEEGFVFVVDRARDSINVGGTKIYPSNVEAALVDHPAVDDAVVVGLPNPRWGEEVSAFVKLRPGATVTGAELVTHCAERVSPLEVPWTVEIVDDVPRDSAGKLLRRVVRDERIAARSG